MNILSLIKFIYMLHIAPPSLEWKLKMRACILYLKRHLKNRHINNGPLSNKCHNSRETENYVLSTPSQVVMKPGAGNVAQWPRSPTVERGRTCTKPQRREDSRLLWATRLRPTLPTPRPTATFKTKLLLVLEMKLNDASSHGHKLWKIEPNK